MQFARGNLRRGRCDKECEEDCSAERITEIECHRERVAARFSESRGRDLDDPERKRDLRDLVFHLKPASPSLCMRGPVTVSGSGALRAGICGQESIHFSASGAAQRTALRSTCLTTG